MSSNFQNVAGFCTNCGSILPPLKDTGDTTCYTCSRVVKAEMLVGTDPGTNSTIHYTVHFNSRSAKLGQRSEKDYDNEEDGPVVERKCPKCGNERMSYATLQLRSADEGQTVFYTCTKCKFKESENS